MPELPDVEIARRRAESSAVGHTVAHVHVRDESLLDGTSRQQLAAQLGGVELTETDRHGKVLALAAGDRGWLRLHFGMTGRLVDGRADADPPEHAALSLDFEDGSSLHFVNSRRLGSIGWTEDFRGFVQEEGLGPDMLEVERDDFRRILEGHRGAIKSRLLDQHAVAGVGSVYGDEALFAAGIRPDRPLDEVSGDEIDAMRRSLRHVLRTAIDREADPERMPESWLLPRREDGADCPGCDGTIRRTTVGGRSTYWCPDCQD